MPVAYHPVHGAKYQLFFRPNKWKGDWEHLDYADNDGELKYMLKEYKLAYPEGYGFLSRRLPRRYWNKSEGGEYSASSV